MQLLLDASRLYNELQIINMTARVKYIATVYTASAEKKKRGGKLTRYEKECITEYESIRSECLSKGYRKDEPFHFHLPAYYFYNLLASQIFYSMMKLKDTIQTYNISRICLSFPLDPFSEVGNIIGINLNGEFIKVFLGLLNNMKNSNVDELMTSPSAAGIIYNHWILNALVPADTNNPPTPASSMRKIKELSSLLIDKKEFHLINLTDGEKRIILDLTYEAFFNSEVLSNSRTDNNSRFDSVYYFVEDLCTDNINFLSKFKNAYGISSNDENIYSNDFIEVFQLLLRIKFSKEISQVKYNYPVEFLSALDEILLARLDTIINSSNDDRYFIVISADEFVKRRIKTDYIKRIEAKLDELESNRPIANKYFIIEHFDNFSFDSQNKIWGKLKNSVFKDGFVLFLIDQRPLSANISKEYDEENVWEYHEDKTKNNISKIFHSFLRECYKDKLESITMDSTTIELIDRNEFADLIGITNFNVETIFRTIKSISKNVSFDYASCTSWYYFREEYHKKLESSEESKNGSVNKQENLQGAILTFINENNSWEIRELPQKLINTTSTDSLRIESDFISDLDKYIDKYSSNEKQSPKFDLEFVHIKDADGKDYWVITDKINDIKTKVLYLNSLALLYIIYMKKYQEESHQNKIETYELYRSVKEYQDQQILEFPKGRAKHNIDNALDAYFYPITNEDQYEEKLKNKIKKDSKKDLLKIKSTLSELFNDHIEIGSQFSSFNLKSNIRIKIDDEGLKIFIKRRLGSKTK